MFRRDANNIIIDGIRYAGTFFSLYELIFKSILDDLFYTEDDMNKYKSMLLRRRTRTNTSINRRADYWAIEDT